MSKRVLANSELIIIILLACVPLFATFPYRVNIFLSWEGAYRISQGQLPFRDFGTPLGGMYWVIPGIFFKLFGTQMVTLIKAQVFINIISALAFRSILRSLQVKPGIILVAVVLFCTSYSFFNFWPWYNHSVIVYELIALAFLFKYIFNTASRYRIAWLIASAVFICFSLLTKQDGGGMSFMICCVLLASHAFIEKKWSSLLVFVGSFVVVLGGIIVLLSPGAFNYWFNHGQPPHSARVSLFEIIDEFFTFSQWIKFYLFIILLLCIPYLANRKDPFWTKEHILFFLLTLAILGEAAVFQVTSYTPPDNNIFFHSFAIAFVLTVISQTGLIDFRKASVILTSIAGIILWWSSVYWKYVQRVIARSLPKTEQQASAGGENVVNRKTFMIYPVDTTDVPLDTWVYSGLRSFKGIYMPKSTVDGMDRLMNMPLVKQGGELKVLNMSELTPLAAEVPFKLERNPELPLWHHLGVGMFNRQAGIYEKRIGEKYYDMVLFEYVPTLNNFYPFRVRDSLRTHYKMVDSFMAPRRGETKGTVEVYVHD